MPDLWRTWGRRVHDRRRALTLTQAELGQRIGSSAQRISQVEHGIHGTPDDLRVRIAAVLETTVDALFPYPPPEPVAESAQDRGAA